MRAIFAMLLAGLALAAVPACVELTGQRISWFHDAATDELRFLIHYDGIHDSGSSDNGVGVEQIPKFVQNGDVMIMDWLFHLDMAKLRAKTDELDPIQREAARLILTLRSTPLGHYREPDGRIGGAQRVTIPGVTGFLRTANGLISRHLREDPKPLDDDLREFPRTLERLRAAAQQDHQWVTLDGHAIRMSFPVHPGEWAGIRGGALDGFVRSVIREHGKDGGKIGFLVQALASAPISYLDEGERVTFVLGHADRPVTWRIRLREDYEPSLEAVLQASVKTDRDRVLAASLLADGASAPGAPGRGFGPPEEAVRAMMGLAERGADSEKKAAADFLRGWAERWNRDGAGPAAPAGVEGRGVDIAGWKEWYRRMKRFPAPERRDGAPKPAPAGADRRD